MPRASTIRANFQLGDCFVGIDDLHTEPVFGHAFFVVHLQRRGDGAIDIRPCNVNDTCARSSEGGERSGEEIKVVCAAAGTFINDLERRQL